MISENTGLILRTLTVFGSPGITVGGKQNLMASGSPVTIQVRSGASRRYRSSQGRRPGGSSGVATPALLKTAEDDPNNFVYFSIFFLETHTIFAFSNFSE